MSTQNTMTGKVCLVTGSNSGTGYVTALEFAKAGANVVMLCRNKVKGIEAQKKIIGESKNQNVELIIADLAEMEQVHDAVVEFKAKHTRLDILVNNAGGMTPERKETSQGFEAMFAGNYLGPVLLTELLLDKIKAAAPAKIINVCSSAHKNAKINFDDLQTKQNFTVGKAYGQSKLAQLLFSYELAESLRSDNIAVNALHPGAVSSGFKNGVSGVSRTIASFIYKVIGISSEKGAETILYLATSPQISGITGKYFYKCKEKESSKMSHDIALRKKMREVTKKLLDEKNMKTEIHGCHHLGRNDRCHTQESKGRHNRNKKHLNH